MINNSKYILISMFTFGVCLFFGMNALAEELESSNFRVEGFTFGGDGEIGESTSYVFISDIGQPFSDDRLSSTSYLVEPGTPNVLVANVPLVKCFETVSDGSTNCDATNLQTDGMVQICGAGGCYDRAHFEIDPQNNPEDTLYSIQIKETADSSYSFLDGATYVLENGSTHDINDYLTESAWESLDFNIVGLKVNTSYDIRITALNGDFTESPASPVATATTGFPNIDFDIDICDNDSIDCTDKVIGETSSPYELNLGILSTTAVKTGDDELWIDLGSNAQSGVVVQVSDSNNGLNSSSTGYTIPSADNTTINLNSVSEGYGFIEFFSSQSYTALLGDFTVETNFNQTGDVVGGVSSTSRNIINTVSDPIVDGRGGFYAKATIDASTLAASDYVDLVTFTVTGSY